MDASGEGGGARARPGAAGKARDGFDTVEEAIASTVEGLDYFMSRGVTPRFTTWCPEPTTHFARDYPEGAPLEYHIRLLEVYRDTLEKHGLQPAPGYGPPGAGNAFFSARSWTRCLRPGRAGRRQLERRCA